MTEWQKSTLIFAVDVFIIWWLWTELDFWPFSVLWGLLSEVCEESSEKCSKACSQVPNPEGRWRLQHSCCNVSFNVQKKKKKPLSFWTRISHNPLTFLSLIMKRGRKFCADPNEKWVKNLMEKIDEKNNNTFKKVFIEDIFIWNLQRGNS